LIDRACGIRQLLAALGYFVLLIPVLLNQFIQFAVGALKLLKPVKAVSVGIFGRFNVRDQIVVKSSPLRQLSKRRTGQAFR
jgi:hypothetical protein